MSVPNTLAGLVIVVIVVVLTVMMAEVWPIGPDYYYTFRPVTEKVVRGEVQLYTFDTRGFFNAPWTLLLMLPTTWVSLPVGQAMLIVTSMMILVATPQLVKLDEPFRVYVWLFALFNLHTFDMLIRAQLDAFPLLGVAIGWWAVQQRRPLGVGSRSGSWRLTAERRAGRSSVSDRDPGMVAPGADQSLEYPCSIPAGLFSRLDGIGPYAISKITGVIRHPNI
jgi:hypothetical protein